MSNSINLDQKYIKCIVDILSVYLDINELKLYIFGSRVNGTACSKSDIDIAIDYKKMKLDNIIKMKIENEIESSTIPFFVDFVDLNDISDDFKNLIIDCMIEVEISKFLYI